MSITVTKEERQEVKHAGDPSTWIVKSEICNTDGTDAEVIVTSWPWDGDHDKIGEEPQEQTVTLPAHQCITMAFEFSEKPELTYTDVYEKEADGTKGKRIAYGVNDLTPKKVRNSDSSGSEQNFVIPIPYPESLYQKLGPNWSPMFVFEPISGVPDGWQIDLLTPTVGEPFRLLPAVRSTPGVLRVVVFPDLEEGSTAEIQLVHHIVGAPEDDQFPIVHNMKFVVDNTPPGVVVDERVPDPADRTILVNAEGLDDVSGVSEMRVFFSVDGPEANWARAVMVKPESTPVGENATFSATIGPFCSGQTIVSFVRMIDGVGNSVDLPSQQIAF